MKHKEYHYVCVWLTHTVVLPTICLHCKSELNRKCIPVWLLLTNIHLRHNKRGINYCIFHFFCEPVMLPVSLDCQFLIAPSVFSNIYLSTEKLWIAISKFIWKSGKYNNLFLVYCDVSVYWLITTKLGYIYDWVHFYNANK
jgi:hypothetical protein